ncbi:hypothetical protein DPMN_164467 [Dreissena polymorpha]|uniref:Alpha-macroglobulin-like TED domain-containing protein n=1 Tax=Dreissena polymorpha TaxID=45954 RepID=A0A9D4EYL1_DREPO|nr:hypothetical protein DPMN_164467 [Dreissena polymorpha]
MSRLHWSSSCTADSYAEEATAFAHLAFLIFDDFQTSHKIVAWLTKHRDAVGKWRSLQATVVAMQALGTYSARAYNQDVDFTVKIGKEGWKNIAYVNRENARLQRLIPNLLVKTGDSKFNVTVSGRGSVVLKIEMFYNRKARDDEI